MLEIGISSWTLGIKDLEQLMLKVKTLGLDGLCFCEDIQSYSPKEVNDMVKKYGLTSRLDLFLLVTTTMF